ncbi:MAG: NAD(P)/FAD-dependent oxidoreductase [Acidobacteria bacterium]|nr:NAD(P)/FAD-dependent oxidoreductase [Acidobacteriota bacterium]
MGAFETPESCRKWKEEFELACPVIPDAEGTLFRQLTNGWVPCNILVGRDGKVLFSENEFDDAGYSTAIAGLYSAPAKAQPEPESGERPIRRASPSAAARIVILGAGVGGVVAAHHLRQRLPRQHRIIVIDRSSDHLFSPSLLWLMVGNRRADQIRRPLTRLAGNGIEFHHDEVAAIDLDRRLVRTRSNAFSFDYLIVSLGARLAPETVEGFDEMAHNLYSLEGCERIRAALETFPGGTIAVLVAALPFKCPAAPYEAAFLVEALCRTKHIRDKTEIHIFTPEHQPMPIAGSAMGDAITAMIHARGIHYHPLYTFQELRPDTREIVSSDGRSERVDLLLGVPPHQAPEVVRSAGLLGVSGWIHVDATTLRAGHDGVFAIGDVTSIRLPGGKMLPKAGVFAHHQAEVVADVIASEIRGTESRASFNGKGYCWIELGDGKAGFASGRFYAEPDPEVRMFHPGRFWHWGKVAFEKWWLRHWL